MTRFVILAARRTGSNLLCTLLHSHPDILCHHEIFNPRGIFYALDHRDGSLDLGTMAARDRDPAAFLQRVWAAALGHACVGFKWTRDPNETVLNHVLGDPGIKKIVLRRENRIKTFVSEQIAHQLDQWEVYRREDLAARPPRLQVELDELYDYMAQNRQFYEWLSASLVQGQHTWVNVVYERLFEEEEQEKIQRFLGVVPTQLRPASIKQNPTDLKELIANFEELAVILQGDPLAAELYDCGP